MSAPEYLIKVDDWKDLTPGTVVRRVSADESKIQQGGFLRINDEGNGLIVINVVDFKKNEFVAEVGLIRPDEGDTLYRHLNKFGESPGTEAARQVLTGWVLYRDNKELQLQLREFVETAYSPEHIIDLKKKDDLPALFVPIQQRFKIGKHKEKIDWDKAREERFREQLASLDSGKHLTYVAFIPTPDSLTAPMFYSIGTKPHLETLANLKRDAMAFNPNRAGHIKCVEEATAEEPKLFLVDAGSNDLGAGVHTSVSIAEMVTDALKDAFPEHRYQPVAGRGAHGMHQSY